jgi:PAS domain S-box-containing protein
MNRILSAVDPATDNAAPDAIDELPVAYVEVDANGTITRANRAAQEMNSADKGKIVGRQVWEFAPESQAELDRSAFLAMMSSGEDPPVTRRTLYSNGEFRAYELHRTLIRDAQGRPAGVRAVTLDVTEAQLAHEEARRARMWLESVLNSMSEAIVITDALGFIRTVNPATEALFGWKAAELEGKVIEKAFPLLAYSPSAESNTPLSFNMALQSRSRGVATLLDRERRHLRVQISTSPVVDKENGFTIGVVSMMQRLSEVSEFVPAPMLEPPPNV